MTRPKARRRELRVYHFGVTLLVLGVVLWVGYGVRSIGYTISENYEQTQCNQGLLVLATSGTYLPNKIRYCKSDVRNALEANR